MVGESGALDRLAGRPARRASTTRLFIAKSLPYFLEIAQPGVSKGAALEFVCERIGFAAADVVGFGDGANDIELLQTAGLGVAVADADPVLVEHADWRVPSVDEDGVALFIQALVDSRVMIDQRLIRSDPDGVREALSRGAAPATGSTRSSSSTARRRELLGQVEATRAERNAAAKAIAEARQRGEDAAAEIAAQTELKAAQVGRRGRARRARGRDQRADADDPQPAPPLRPDRHHRRGRRVELRMVGSQARVRLRAARPPRHRRPRGARADRLRGRRARLGQPLPLPARRPRAARVRDGAVGAREARRARASCRSRRRCW